MGAGHVGAERCLVEKDKAGRIKQPLLAYPAPAGARDVRPLLFASVQDFFLSVNAVTLQERMQRRAAAGYLPLVHRRHNLIRG